MSNPPDDNRPTEEARLLRCRMLDLETEHTLKNHLAIILGYCELLLSETPAEDSRQLDIAEMHRAASAMMSILREVQQ